ncbi:MAG: phosphate ABC transporter substrate-binding/OmpA family protein [Cyanobacteria bacterium J06650_10]
MTHSNHSHAGSSFKRSAVLTEFEKVIASRVDDPHAVVQMVTAVEKWTNGQPTLTRVLCDCILDCTSRVDNGLEPKIVDAVVQRQIVERWSQNAAAAHLNKIADAVLSYEIRDTLLILYMQILQRGAIAANNSPEQEVLLRSGLVQLKNGKLRVANSIYARIFNLTWIELQLPGITRPVAIVSEQSRSRAALAPVRIKRKLPLLLGVFAALGLGALLLRSFGQTPTSRLNLASSAEISELEERAAAGSANAAALTPLTMLADTFSGYSTFRNDDFQQALQEVGIEVDYADEFDQSLRAEALTSGDADLMMTTLDQFLQQQPQGKIVGLIDRTVGADAVVLNTKRYPQLKSLIDLEALVAQSLAAGETLSISYAEDTPSEHLARVLDAKFDNFDLADFELRPVADASEAWALMQNPTDNVAIAVLWEPYVTQAKQKGYSVVLSSDDAQNAIVDVLVASDQLLESNPDIISTLLEVYYRRIDANARDATQLQTQVAEDGDLPVDEAVTIINGIDFFTAIEAKNWMNDGTLQTRIGATAAVLKLSGELKTLPTEVGSLYTSTYVVNAANNTQTLIDLIRADNPTLADKLAGIGSLGDISAVSADQIQQAPDIGTLKTSGQVSFTSGSAQLTEEGTKTLVQVANELKEFNGQNVAVRIIGHTSRTGDAASNQQLSQARTSVVVERLKQLGVTLSFLPEGKGFSAPLPGIDPTDNRNQRTEIRLVRVN